MLNDVYSSDHVEFSLHGTIIRVCLPYQGDRNSTFSYYIDVCGKTVFVFSLENQRKKML